MLKAKQPTHFQDVPKAHRDDTLAIEVGDSKQPEFHPQLKLMRWDNEVNFSVRLLHDEAAPATTQSEGRVCWRGRKMECHFYDSPASSEEGGFEVDVRLLEKPATNVVRFSIRTKGLDFFYQPPLTDEDIADGCVRPERAVGSYAVYHSARPMNLVGGKSYKAGKAFHIYRPRIKDSAGLEVWGELQIDADAGILSVTIPQDFLDNAVYPVVQAAGLDFGYTSVGASETTYSIAKICIKAASNPASNGTLDSISSYCQKFSAGTVHFTSALYDHDAVNNEPQARLAYKETGTVVPDTFAWTTHVPNAGALPSVTSGTQYWIGCSTDRVSDDQPASTKYDTGAADCWNRSASQFWDDPWVTQDLLTRQFSLYATYTSSGGGGHGSLLASQRNRLVIT
jgi:hypothetical protein